MSEQSGGSRGIGSKGAGPAAPPGGPLLPRSIRMALSDARVPEWFRRHLWLIGPVTYGDLDSSVWDRFIDTPRDLERAVVDLVSGLKDRLDALKVKVGTPEQVDLISRAGPPAPALAGAAESADLLSSATMTWSALIDAIGIAAAIRLGRSLEEIERGIGPVIPLEGSEGVPPCVQFSPSGEWRRRSTIFGEHGSELFPEALSEYFESVRLPATISRRLHGLAETYADLRPSLWQEASLTTDEAKKISLSLMSAVLADLPDAPIFPDWPDSLVLDAVPWRRRSVTAIRRLGAWNDIQRLRQLTYRSVADAPSSGALTILDIAITGRAYAGLAPSPGRIDHPADKLMQELLELCLPAASTEWFESVHEDDPRCGWTVGTIRQTLNRTVRISGPDLIVQLREGIARLLQAGDREHPEHVEVALKALYKTSLKNTSGLRLEALLRRQGWLGEDPLTLQEAGDLVGITRERIRQIAEKADRNRSRRPPVIPALDFILDLLEETVPIRETDFKRQQVVRGLSNVGLTARGLRTAAAWTHRQFPEIEILGRGDECLLLAPGTQATENAIAAELRRQSSAYGASSISEAVGRLQALRKDVSREQILRVLKQIPAAVGAGDWWIVPTNRNRMQNEIRKMLAAGGALSVEQLHKGIRRHSGFRQIDVVPPKEMVALMCDQLHWVTMRDGRAMLDPPAEFHEVLGKTEATMVEVLKAAPGGVLSRQDFTRACLERGMNDATFSVYSSFSPVLDHPAINVWTVRGTAVSPIAVERIREQSRQRSEIATLVSWDQEGYLCITRELGLPAYASKVIGMPVSMKPYLAKRSFVAMSDGVEVGTIQVAEDGNSWGWGPFLRKAGADEQAILVARFDLVENRVLLTLGTPDDLRDV